MKTLIVALAVMASTGSAATAQSYDPEFGGANIKRSPYRLMTYGYAPDAYYEGYGRVYGVPWRYATRVSRNYPAYDGRVYRLGY
jgi:hypothetical protein